MYYSKLKKDFALSHLCFGFSLWILGFIVAYNLNFSAELSYPNEKFQEQAQIGLLISKNKVLNIILNNSLMVISIYLLGFVSFGIYTIGTFLYNGFILGLYIKKALLLQMVFKQIIMLLVFHGPIEIFAFILAGSLSFKSWKYLSLFNKDKLTKQDALAISPSLFSLFIPFLLILIAAPIEYLAYDYYK